MKVAVLITCHERKETTLACLASLRAQRDLDGVTLQPIVVDSASRDGTAAAIRATFPEVEVLDVGDDVFWAGGMRIAALRALERHPGAAHLWVNDDVVLDPDAVVRLLRAVDATDGRALVAGTVRDPVTAEATYGGRRRSARWHPLHHVLVQPIASLQDAHVANGNVLLVPPRAVDALGPPSAYRHAMADYDYSFRARRLGLRIVIAPDTYGTCPWHGAVGPVWGRRRTPPLDFWRLLRVQGAPFWPLFWPVPYLMAALRFLRLIRPQEAAEQPGAGRLLRGRRGWRR